MLEEDQVKNRDRLRVARAFGVGSAKVLAWSVMAASLRAAVRDEP